MPALVGLPIQQNNLSIKIMIIIHWIKINCESIQRSIKNEEIGGLRKNSSFPPKVTGLAEEFAWVFRKVLGLVENPK